MKFQDIPGQASLKSFFSKMIADERVPHALLFAGGEGHGKLALALGLTMFLQCKDRQDSGPCGECSSCRRVMTHIHPDVHFAFPVIKKDKLLRLSLIHI